MLRGESGVTKWLIPAVAAVVAVTLAAVGALVVYRDEHWPVRKSIHENRPRLPALIGGAPTITCGAEVTGQRKEIFGTALFMPQWVGTAHDDTAWEVQYLQDSAGALRRHLATVSLPGSGRPFLRFGHQPTDGYLDSNGTLRTGYHWKEALDSNQWSIDDYIAYTRLVGASPQVVVNFGTGSASDAADLVAYSNGTNPDDPMVALRRQRGHEDPYAIEVFEIGNEQYGHWEAGFDTYPDGSVGSRDPAAYIRRVNEFATQMRSRSPTPVKLYAPLTNWELNSYSEPDLKSIVAQTSETLDGYAVHYYPLPADGQAPEMWGGMSHYLGMKLAVLNQLLRASTSKPMEIAITEWAGSAFPTHMGRNWLTGLLMVDSYIALAQQGISIANYFASVTPPGVPGGYSYWLDGDLSRPAPTLIAAEESARHLGRDLLAISISDVPAAVSRSYIGDNFEFPILSAMCSEGPSGRSLIVVNRSLQPQFVNFNVALFGSESIEVTTVGAQPLAEHADLECKRYAASKLFSLKIPAFSAGFLSFPLDMKAGVRLGASDASRC